MLPAAHSDGTGAPFVTALFTATSAVCVTGLSVVDTSTYWTGFGQATILALIQIGGLGIMTGATLLGMLVSKRLRLSTRLVAQTETPSLDAGDLAGVLKLVLATHLVVELAVTAVLAARLHFGHGEAWDAALWNGLFHAVSGFNNAGFSTYSDNLMGFAGDALVLLPVCLAIIVGGIGFPVLHEVIVDRRRGPLSLYTKITLLGTVVLLVGGTCAVLAYEWANPRTLGALGVGERVMGALFHAVNSRTAGFNAADVGAMRSETLAITDVMMMIGGGGASTAGGVKIATIVVLMLMVVAEVRGEPDAVIFRRRIAADVQRQAVAVVFLWLAIAAVAVLALESLTDFSLEALAFEAVSAFSTTGLSTGITGKLPASAQLVLVALMYVGRIGTVAFATALALNTQRRPFRYPEERPIVG